MKASGGLHDQGRMVWWQSHCSVWIRKPHLQGWASAVVLCGEDR